MIKDEQVNQASARKAPLSTKQPKETLYISNINEKIKAKDVKYAIYWLFQSFGQITQIICKKNNKMRGQVFVIFKETNEAATAKNNLNGYAIFGKPMKIQFSNKRSKVALYNSA